MLRRKSVDPEDFLFKAQLLGYSLRPVELQKYTEYIKSKHWIRRKELYYAKYKRECAVCFVTGSTIDLNHAYYGNLGQERDEDLTPFCRDHHTSFHQRYGVKFSMREETAIFIRTEQEKLLCKTGSVIGMQLYEKDVSNRTGLIRSILAWTGFYEF